MFQKSKEVSQDGDLTLPWIRDRSNFFPYCVEWRLKASQYFSSSLSAYFHSFFAQLLTAFVWSKWFVVLKLCGGIYVISSAEYSSGCEEALEHILCLFSRACWVEEISKFLLRCLTWCFELFVLHMKKLAEVRCFPCLK